MSWTQKNCNDGNQTGSSSDPIGLIIQSRILEIQETERVKSSALIRQADKLCSLQKAQTDAVCKRLGIPGTEGPLPSHHSTVLPTLRQSPETSIEDNDFWKEVYTGAQAAAHACKEAQKTSVNSPSSSVGSAYSLICTDTPTELRNLPCFGEADTEEEMLKPSAGLQPKKRLSRIPVLSVKLAGAEKQTTDGIKLQTVINKDNTVVDEEHSQHVFRPQIKLPPISHKAIVAQPLAPIVSQTKIQGPRRSMHVHSAPPLNEARVKSCDDGLQKPTSDRVVLPPLVRPVETLLKGISLLTKDDWNNKMNGLRTFQSLAQHQPDVVVAKLHEVCLSLIVEVKNLRSAVACEAIDTLGGFYVHLQRKMDPEVERTGQALLLKLAQTSSEFIHQPVNLALDAMVQNCCPHRVLTALLNTGLSHRCVAVRGSAAQHLHQLCDKLGASRIFAAKGTFTQQVLTAVCKMSVDAAPEMRHHGLTLLQELGNHKDFEKCWKKIVPEKERHCLEKTLKKGWK